MNPEEKGSFSIYYREDGLVFGDWGGKLFLILDGVSYVLTGNPREPDLFFKGSDRTMLTLRQAFTPDELCRAVRRAVRENGTITVISGKRSASGGIPSISAMRRPGFSWITWRNRGHTPRKRRSPRPPSASPTRGS